MSKANINKSSCFAVIFIGLIFAFGASQHDSGETRASGSLSEHQHLFESDKIAQVAELRSHYENATEAVVMVGLRAPVAVNAFASWDDASALFDLRTAVAEIQADVLIDLEESVFTPHQIFEVQAGFSGAATLEGLARLIEDPRVLTIEPVRDLVLHTEQGLAVVDPGGIRFELNGAGMSIAICDSGVDYDHKALGGNGNGQPDDFPNAKIAGGFNFDNGTANPYDTTAEGHGTSVAGIAAGLTTTLAGTDYAGGVAQGARVYALKVTVLDSITATTDRLVAAWNWIVANKNADPANPIGVVCMSLGSGRFPQTCDDLFPVMAAAARNLVRADISVFTSSGNDGYCDAVAVPACLSDAISVGAVYDAEQLVLQARCTRPTSCIGGPLPGICASGWACQDLSTSPEHVACYSNSSSALDLLAPADKADAPVRAGRINTFGGTSAAAPYAAGAALSLQQGAGTLLGQTLSPEALRTYLKLTGIPVDDPKSEQTDPRVNLSNAISLLGANTPCHGKNAKIVLQVNGQSGLDPAGGGPYVQVNSFGQIDFEIARPDPDSNGSYIVHLNMGDPTANSIVPLPRQLGSTCFPLLLQQGARPSAVFNTIGKENQIGSNNFFGQTIGRPNLPPVDGFGVMFGSSDISNLMPPGTTWTLQGVINDPSVGHSRGSQATVTNAVLIEMTDV